MAPKYKKEFSPETWMELSYKSVQSFQSLEDAILQYQFRMLLNGIELSAEEWLDVQMAQSEQVNKGIIGIIRKGRPTIKDYLKESFNEATGIAKDKLSEVNKEGKPINISNSEAVKARLGLVDENFKLLALNHTRVTASLPAKIYSNIISQPGHTTWTMEKHLEEFHKAIELGYKKELPNMTSVNYANGRNVSFKSYVEMAIRTEINNVAVDMMQEGCKGLGIVLFLASTLSDSAPDHAPYQGKCYILQDWRSIIPSSEHQRYESLIQRQNIKTLEWVKEIGTYTTDTGKTYPIALGVRPNCRHTFTPITYEQAASRDKTLDELGLKGKGTYNKDKYIQTQKQRNLERNIRQLKLEYNNKVAEIKASKNEEDALRLSKEADMLKRSIRNAQERLRDLIDKYPYLDRQYSRENPMRMISDLGVKT